MRYASAFLGILSACAIASAGMAAGQSVTSKPARAVVELFTSQGCSSCVSADAYFEDLVKRDDIVALSLHVDYWDYLGWRDTLGDAAYTARQRAYASAHGSRRVYTPQMVVNGGKDYVGSDRRSIDAAIDSSTLSVPVTMRQGDGTVEIEVAALPKPHAKPATIRLVLLTSEAQVAIGRGENAGSTIDYYNVVRGIRPVGMWDGDAVKITLPEHEIMPKGIDGCAIIVQEDDPNGPGRIVGAATLNAW
jgi:hypothetical protein